MIEIKQYSPITKELESEFLKQSDVVLNIDLEALNRDREALKSKLSKAYSKYDKENLVKLIAYLTKIEKRAEKLVAGNNRIGTIEITWSLSKGVPKAYPFQLLDIPEYGINTPEYITTVNSERVIELDYSGVADLISFEIMNRDIEYAYDKDDEPIMFNNEEIEKRLDEVGIITIHDFGLAKQLLFPDISPYKLSKAYRIENSAYIDYESKKIKDYFGHYMYKPDNYYAVVDHSTKHAMALIYRGLAETKLNTIPFKLAAITNTKIILVASMDDWTNIDKKIHETAVVRIFGRKFEVEPTIKVY